MKKAIILFVPVIHNGYLKFLNKNKGDIFILDKDIINTFVHLTRDLRLIDPDVIVKLLRTINPDRKIELLNFDKLNELSNSKYSFIMSEDEVSHEIHEKYLGNNKVIYDSIFLRWNKVITLTENEIPAHRRITKSQFHRKYIEIAKTEAEKSSDWWRQIASLIIKDKRILFQGHNHHLPSDHHLSTFGDPRSNFDAGQHQEIYTSIHSEASLIAQAAHDGVSLSGADIYVTTFPCPNCARLIVKSGIKRLFYSKGYSLLDAEKILNHFGVEVFLVK
jgi:dCMP deaminase